MLFLLYFLIIFFLLLLELGFLSMYILEDPPKLRMIAATYQDHNKYILNLRDMETWIFESYFELNEMPFTTLN